jgi:hypothetical protein
VYTAPPGGNPLAAVPQPRRASSDGDDRRYFGFAQKEAYSAGEHLDWSSVAVDGNGELLLTAGLGGGRTRIGFGQVDPDGQFIVWWQSEVAGRSSAARTWVSCNSA